MNIAAWVLSLLGPAVVRVITAAGFTALTYTGVTELLDMLVNDAQTRWAALPLKVLQLATLSGIPQVLGMVLGAYTARVALWLGAGATKYVLKRG